MNKERLVVDKTMKRIASKLIRTEIDKWPPDCCGFTYQPKRPVINSKTTGSKTHDPSC